jgi:endonuclease/exonuclease/phosphatase family metal-dependent hydrolase
MKKLIAVLFACTGVAVAPAAILLDEPFDYANGSLITASGGTWTHTSGTTTGELDVTSGAANLTYTEGEDVAAALTATSANVYYAGFTVRFSALPSSSGSYFAHFDGSGFRGRVFALVGGASTDQFRLGLSSTSATINQTNAANLSLNTDYRIVVRLTNTTGVATLWINPASESDPSVTTDESSSGSTVNSFALRQASGIGTLGLDELVVATTFAEALSTNAPPLEPPGIVSQPESQSALVGETVVFSAGVSGSSLAYQWQFNGTNLPGATNPALTLTNVVPGQAGEYVLVVTNTLGATNTQPALLSVLPLGVPFLSVLTYNTHGNFIPDWTTNSAQVQAIGRQVMYLDPDIITFQEIPMTNSGWAEMSNFVTAFRPGFSLATNSGTDGYIRSAILSRYPITRSQSWLDGADLKPFGYTNTSTSLADNFTRDLFEAEISVPGFAEPMHVFTTHLKSGNTSSDDAAKRAAEASAVSNFFASVFLPAHGSEPYLLTGDMNEDVLRPAVGGQQPIERMVNSATGLRLSTPLNPLSGSELTFSIRAVEGLTKRYDYILPCGLLYSNFAGAQVFRTDLLDPLPPSLLSNDCRTASDHLPVLMYFANPYDGPFRLLSLEALGGSVALRWESASNRVYDVEISSNLTQWTTLASNLTATGTNLSFSTNMTSARQFFRVHRLP